MNGQNCPDCGTALAPEGAAACDCRRRTVQRRTEARAAEAAMAEERKEARAAEAALAADYGPWRVRPYVSLPESAAPRPGVRAQPLPAAVEAPRAVAEAVVAPPAPVDERRRRRLALFAVAGAATGVVAVALLVGGLHSGGSEDDEALPDESPRPAESFAPLPSPSKSTAHASPSKSPSPVRSSAPAAPAPPRPAPSLSRSVSRPKVAASPVLRKGDRGPEVAELQRRLQQAFAYAGRADGVYDAHVANAVRGYQFTRGVEGDPPGVYGATTRRSLEARTRG